MNILITGATGYIGTALVQYLHRDKDNHIRTFDTGYFGNALSDYEGIDFITGDIRNYKAVERASAGMDAVIHLAGVVTDELVDMNPTFGAEVNVGGTENIIRAAKVCNVGRLVYASSSSVYGLAAEDGIPDEDAQPIPKTKYAAQKLDGERVVLLANRQGRVATAVRQATAMGPAPRMRLDTVVNIFSKQAFFDGVITPYGGDQFRSNVHVQDVVRFYRLLLTHEGVAGKPWNLTQGNFTVRDIAAAVQTVAGEEGIKAVVETVDVEDSRSYRMDGSRAEKELGFKCVRSIADAVRDNFRWFQQGAINPDDPIYRNNARMGDLVTKGE
tara:strand:- start:2653 stop:3636 length:984 start_codon:yes stop_codon:yes gene_type:complete